MEYLKLPTSSGELDLPMLGLGTYQICDPSDFHIALDMGYQLLDTSIVYGNESIIGDVINDRIEKGKMKREDIFLQSKLSPNYMGTAENVRKGVERSLRDLKVNYIDLYLIHNPCGIKYRNDEELFPLTPSGELEIVHHDLVTAWKGLEECVEEGLIKAIGVSNFNSKQLDRVTKAAKVPIANNQVEVHAYLSQEKLCQFCWDRGITVTGYGSLGSAHLKNTPDFGKPVDVISDPVVVDISKKHNKTSAQVLLRNLVQRGIAVIPKSSNPSRMKRNSEIFDFILDNVDMKRIADLNQNKRAVTIDMFRKHPEYSFNEEF